MKITNVTLPGTAILILGVAPVLFAVSVALSDCVEAGLGRPTADQRDLRLSVPARVKMRTAVPGRDWLKFIDVSYELRPCPDCRATPSAAMVRSADPGNYGDGNGLMLRVRKSGLR